MALRNIIKEGDPVLNKKCRPVEKFDSRLHTLLDDMRDTMYNADGVGLAAPQVGILRCALVIDIGEGLIELVNPKIVMKSGEQHEQEGCLSCPGEYGITIRPKYVKVKGQDRFGNDVTYEGSDLLARALCHEIDHLNGVLFKAHVTEMLQPN
ncbi:MAG: peptide deformylase [Clostridiales bacterium]|nr:peptide deformylase [Clostridiales bacterium]